VKTNQTSASKIVPLDAIRNLVEGSFEHLGAALDEAVAKNFSSLAKTDTKVSRIATFKDHVVLGSDAGEYFNVKYENKSGEIVLSSAEKVDVPVVTPSNAAKSVKEFSLSAVDALMSEDAKSAAKRLLVLVDLQEQKEVVDARDYVAESLATVASGRPWRQAFSTQQREIHRQVVDKLESIRESTLEAKYKALYETDEIPEENFENYRGMATNDLGALADRLRAVHEAVEAAYLPFRDSLSKDELDESDEDVLSHFCFFSEDLIEDLGEVRSLVADTIENEQCVMCLGQVYDTIAESLADYEIAGTFVQRMAGAFDEAA
jgi:hypothetical protein